jgi:hypothetical protein
MTLRFIMQGSPWPEGALSEVFGQVSFKRGKTQQV